MRPKSLWLFPYVGTSNQAPISRENFIIAY